MIFAETGNSPGMEPLPTRDPHAAPTVSEAALRPLGQREVEILHRVLDACRVDGIEQLLDHVRIAQVDPRSDATCRIYVVHPDAPRAPFAADGRAKLGSFPVRSPHGRVIGEVGVWVEFGHLRALQYATHDASHPAMVLPPPESIEVPTIEPAPSSAQPATVTGGRQAILGLRALGTIPSAPAVVETPVRSRRTSMLLAGLVMLGLVIAIATFLLGASRGADLDAARAEGAAAGAALGAEHGEVAGAFAGATEGELAGRGSTHQTSFIAARARAIAVARREAVLERQRAAAAAAAAAPSYVNYSCSGYRDSYGNWICA